MNRTIRKALLVAVAAIGLSASFGVASASASQPATPGCFGTVRADTIHAIQDDASFLPASLTAGPGASGWGHEASNRAGDNGTINQQWRATYADNCPVVPPAV